MSGLLRRKLGRSVLAFALMLLLSVVGFNLPAQTVLADAGNNYPWGPPVTNDAVAIPGTNTVWGYTTCPSNDSGCMGGTVQGSDGKTYGINDPWTFALRFCTSWVAWALHDRNGFETPGSLGNAATWATRASGDHYTVNSTPAVGAAAQWNAASWNNLDGHVAWVSSVNNDGSVNIEEYNGDLTGQYGTATLKQGSTNPLPWPDNFIHFKDLSAVANAPGALARDSADMDTFYAGASNNLVDRYWNSSTGWASTSWSVGVNSAPSAVARDSSDMDVLFRNTSNNLVDQHWNSASGWGTTTLTTNGAVTGNPTVIARDSGDMDVFYRDSSSNLVDVHWNSASGWATSSWSDNVQGDPSPTDRTSGSMDVFFRNNSNNLIDRLWISTSGWSWATLVSNGTIGGSPGAVTPDSSHMDAFYRDGSTGNLYDRWWDSVDGWNTSSWSVGISGRPSAIARTSSNLDVFFRNSSNNNLVDQHWDSVNGWGTATPYTNGDVATDPSAIDRDSGDMDVFFGNNSSKLVDSYWNSTSGWGWTNWPW